MTLILNNDDVQSVLTMEITMKALEESYRQIALEILKRLFDVDDVCSRRY